MATTNMLSMFEAGQEVQLSGLNGNGKKYNEKLGIVLKITSQGRVKVHLRAATKIIVAVLPTNLLLVKPKILCVHVDDDTTSIDKFENVYIDDKDLSNNAKAAHMKRKNTSTSVFSGLAFNYKTPKRQHDLYAKRKKEGFTGPIIYTLKDVLDMPALLCEFDVWKNKWLAMRQNHHPHVNVFDPSTEDEHKYNHIENCTLSEFPWEIAIKVRDEPKQAKSALKAGVLSSLGWILNGTPFGGWDEIVCDKRDTIPAAHQEISMGDEVVIRVYPDDIPEEVAARLMQVHFSQYKGVQKKVKIQMHAFLTSGIRKSCAKGEISEIREGVKLSLDYNTHFEQFDLGKHTPRESAYAFGTQAGEEHSQAAGWLLEMCRPLELAISVLHELCFYRCGCTAIANSSENIVGRLLALPFFSIGLSANLLLSTADQRLHHAGLQIFKHGSVQSIYQVVIHTLGRLLNGLDKDQELRVKVASKILAAERFWNEMNAFKSNKSIDVHTKDTTKSIAQLLKLTKVAAANGECKRWKSRYCMERNTVAENEKCAKELGVAPPSKFVKEKQCLQCDKRGIVGKTLLLCGRCKNAAFCNATCQKKCWPTHREECVKQKRAAATGSQLL